MSVIVSILLFCWLPHITGSARELPGKLETDRNPDHHPEPGFVREQRSHRPQALFCLVRCRGFANGLLMRLVKPTAVLERCRQDPLESRRAAQHQVLGLVQALRFGQRLDRRIEVGIGVGVVQHSFDAS